MRALVRLGPFVMSLDPSNHKEVIATVYHKEKGNPPNWVLIAAPNWALARGRTSRKPCLVSLEFAVCVLE